jgi:hypothetical protein
MPFKGEFYFNDNQILRQKFYEKLAAGYHREGHSGFKGWLMKACSTSDRGGFLSKPGQDWKAEYEYFDDKVGSAGEKVSLRLKVTFGPGARELAEIFFERAVTMANSTRGVKLVDRSRTVWEF